MEVFPHRADGLEINPVADGCIVYQPEADRVHYLNHTAALILELCNGRIAVDDMPVMLRTAYGLAEAPVAEVREYLERLRAERIIR